MLDEVLTRQRVLPEPTRRRFTVAEAIAMVEAGVIPEDERFEMIDGDILAMSPLHHAHESVKLSLVEALMDKVDRRRWRVGVETSLYVDERSFVNPDVSVLPRDVRTDEARGPDTCLVVEVADTTPRRDRDEKGPLYARAGVPLFWLIDVNARRITIHERPVDGVWTLIRVAGEADVLTVPALPGFSFRLAEAT
jgi:Uma2 family endonuclease